MVPHCSGVTGSGKTEVYLEAVSECLRQGRQALVLLPEIALTAEFLNRVEARFGAFPAEWHSGVTLTERRRVWKMVGAGGAQMVIGARSALFLPYQNLGLIVVDEEHDSSYKQQEGLRYSARDLATKRAQTNNIPIVLGSATPSLESIFNVKRERYKQLSLPYRAGGAHMPTYHLIDMRGQNHTDGISLPLERVIRGHLDAAGQVLVRFSRPNEPLPFGSLQLPALPSCVEAQYPCLKCSVPTAADPTVNRNKAISSPTHPRASLMSPPATKYLVISLRFLFRSVSTFVQT